MRRRLAGPVGAVGAVLRAVLVLGLSRGQRLEELEDGVGSLEALAVAVCEQRDLVLPVPIFLPRRDLLCDEVEAELRQPLTDGGRIRAPLGLVELDHIPTFADPLARKSPAGRVENQRGAVDLPYIASLYGKPEEQVVSELGDLIFNDPESVAWQTADAYLSGNVRSKLAAAERAGPAYARNAESLRAVQPGDIDANLGAPCA